MTVIILAASGAPPASIGAAADRLHFGDPSEWQAQPPSAVAGAPEVAQVGEEVRFWGHGAGPDAAIVGYAWDFNDDGVPDFVSRSSGASRHRFETSGDYRCRFSVTDTYGRVATDTRRVIVVATRREVGSALSQLRPQRRALHRPADGLTRRYALMINGGAESRFWTDVQLAYAMLADGYGISPADIFLLNHDGSDPSGGNPGGMIDSPAQSDSLTAIATRLAAMSDADDEVFIWITDHGRGYTGPLSEGGKYFGYMDGRADVDPGDEPDFLESDFKLRSTFTGGDYGGNHGMDHWAVYRRYISGGRTWFYRNNYVSHFDSLYVTGLDSLVSDDDIDIECLKDYALGDTNRDGIVDTSAGEVFDFDADGIPPYDHATGEYDAGDWGDVDDLSDFAYLNTQVPEGARPYRLFDLGLQGKMCIDLNHTGGDPEVDGRDEDGLGLFDWMDVNQDGDVADTVSVDEKICLRFGDYCDDELAELLALLPAATITVVGEPCFFGGFVEDLSAPGRTICAATIEEAVSWGNLFIRGFVAALHGVDQYGNSVDADWDRNGCVSMLEAFNFAADHDPYDEIPQYDDSGDGVSQAATVPAGGDGPTGARTYLCALTPVDAPAGSDATQPHSLVQAAPNPSRGRVTIRFFLPTPGDANLLIVDVAGRRVRQLGRGHTEGGRHVIEWDTLDDASRPVPNGIFFVQLRAPGLEATRRLLVIR